MTTQLWIRKCTKAQIKQILQITGAAHLHLSSRVRAQIMTHRIEIDHTITEHQWTLIGLVVDLAPADDDNPSAGLHYRYWIDPLTQELIYTRCDYTR